MGKACWSTDRVIQRGGSTWCACARVYVCVRTDGDGQCCVESLLADTPDVQICIPTIPHPHPPMRNHTHMHPNPPLIPPAPTQNYMHMRRYNAYAHSPGGVLAAACNDAKQRRDIDVVVCDTAGRLHTAYALMEELASARRAVGNVLPGQPCETLLVLDGTTGATSSKQCCAVLCCTVSTPLPIVAAAVGGRSLLLNPTLPWCGTFPAPRPYNSLPSISHPSFEHPSGLNMLNQAREFNDAVPLTGLILTKLDGTARGGAVVSVVDQLKLPVKFIGVGEALEDLQPFDAASFAEALFPDGGSGGSSAGSSAGGGL